jgi:type II secretion system protein N
MKKWFLYILYICAAVVFFLYYLFPSDTARDFISSYMKKSHPDYRLDVSQIKPVFPPGIRLRNVGISYKNDLWGELDQFIVTPGYFSLFSERKTFNFRGTAYEGEISGTVDLVTDGNPPGIKLNADLKQIRLEDIDRFQTIFGRKVFGNLDGVVSYQNSKGVDEKTDIRLNLSDCAVEIAHPLINIGIDQISFKSIDAVISIDKQTLELKQCKALGTQADGDLAGTIRFRRPFEKSLLDFRGTLKLHHTLLAKIKDIVPGGLFQQRKNESGGLPVKVYGTIETPKFSFR